MCRQRLRPAPRPQAAHRSQPQARHGSISRLAPEEEEAAEEEAVAVEAQGAVHAEDESVDGDNGACSTTTTTLT